MPQKFQLERRYVNTFPKMLFYTHALRRFDKPAEDRRRDNLLVLWADEAQRFVSASEDGMSDYNCMTSFAKRKRPLSPLRNPQPRSSRRLDGKKLAFSLSIFAIVSYSNAADEEGAVESADFSEGNA